MLTPSERTAAARLFTEGVNFMDIIKAIKEINVPKIELLPEKNNKNKIIFLTFSSLFKKSRMLLLLF